VPPRNCNRHAGRRDGRRRDALKLASSDGAFVELTPMRYEFPNTTGRGHSGPTGRSNDES
jgi:hypothetical protein